MAVEHGRPVILTDQVVADTEWAKRMVGRPGVHVAASLSQVMDHVHAALNQESEVDALLSELAGSML